MSRSQARTALSDIYISDKSFDTIVKASLPNGVLSNLSFNINGHNQTFRNILFESQQDGKYKTFKQGRFQTVSYVSTLLHTGHDVQSNQETIIPVFQELNFLHQQGKPVFPTKILCGLHFPGHYNAAEIEIEQNAEGKFILKIGRYEPFSGYLPILSTKEPVISIISAFQQVFGDNLEIQSKPVIQKQIQQESVCCGPISAEFISNLIKTGDAFLGIDQYSGSGPKNMNLRQDQGQRIQEAVRQGKIMKEQALNFLNDHRQHHFTEVDSRIIQRQFKEFKLLQEIGDAFIGVDYIAVLSEDYKENFLQKFTEKEQNRRSWVDYFFGFDVYAPETMTKMEILSQRHEDGILQKVLQRFNRAYFQDVNAPQNQIVESANSPQNQILSLNHLVKFAYFLYQNKKITQDEFKEILSKKITIFGQEFSVIDFINQVFQDNFSSCKDQIAILKNTISSINLNQEIKLDGLNQDNLVVSVASELNLSEFSLLLNYLKEHQNLQKAIRRSKEDEKQRKAEEATATKAARTTATFTSLTAEEAYEIAAAATSFSLPKQQSETEEDLSEKSRLAEAIALSLEGAEVKPEMPILTQEEDKRQAQILPGQEMARDQDGPWQSLTDEEDPDLAEAIALSLEEVQEAEALKQAQEAEALKQALELSLQPLNESQPQPQQLPANPSAQPQPQQLQASTQPQPRKLPSPPILKSLFQIAATKTIAEKEYKFYTKSNSKTKTQNQDRFNFSSTKDLTKEPEVSSFKKELHGIFEKSYRYASIDYQDAIKFALIAVKNGGINGAKEKFKEEYKKLQPEISEEELTQKLKQAVKFSALFQLNCNEKDLKTGNQNYDNFVGMRLKRLDPKLLYEIYQERFEEDEKEILNPIKEVIKETAQKIEVQNLVPRSIVGVTSSDSVIRRDNATNVSSMEEV